MNRDILCVCVSLSLCAYYALLLLYTGFFNITDCSVIFSYTQVEERGRGFSRQDCRPQRVESLREAAQSYLHHLVFVDVYAD